MHPLTPAFFKRSPLTLVLLLALCVTAPARADQAAGELRNASPGTEGLRGTATPTALKLTAQPHPLAARFVVTVRPGRGGHARGSTHTWHFQRNETQVALLKGPIDEIWHRDARGLLSFERVFHDDQQAVDYGSGELAALGVQADWVALSTFVDPRELVGLRLISRKGHGRNEIVNLKGKTANGGSLALEWQPALQLPRRLARTEANGRVTHMDLAEHAAEPRAGWPLPGARSAQYLRFDAADFGDMDHETVVKKSEALDIRSGWRTAHHHD